MKVQHLWFNQGEGIIDGLIAGSKDFKEGSLVYVLENINLFLSCIDEISHATSQIREFDGWCKVNIILSNKVSQTFHVKLAVTTNCFSLVSYVCGRHAWAVITGKNLFDCGLPFRPLNAVWCLLKRIRCTCLASILESWTD